MDGSEYDMETSDKHSVCPVGSDGSPAVLIHLFACLLSSAVAQSWD